MHKILQLLLEIIFEEKIDYSKHEKHIIKHSTFFEIYLKLLNFLAKNEWISQVKLQIEGISEIIEGIFSNQLVVSNVIFLNKYFSG